MVDVLEEYAQDYPGLNLTWEVRDGILHHTGDTPPQTLEGQVVRICDRIAYLNHDVEDAVRAGILSEEDLLNRSWRCWGPPVEKGSEP